MRMGNDVGLLTHGAKAVTVREPQRIFMEVTMYLRLVRNMPPADRGDCGRSIAEISSAYANN